MKRPIIRFDRNSAPVQGQGYGINWDTVDSRYTSLHDYLLTAPQVMDPERLRCLLDVYDEFDGEPVIYIRAKLLERVRQPHCVNADRRPLRRLCLSRVERVVD